MIENLYGKYFQKSKSFLYPILGVPKNVTINPIGTYLSIKGSIDPDDMKLVCVYAKNDSPEFKEFEVQMLISNPLYDKTICIKDHILYVFDFQIYKNDWFNFLLGKYSKLSTIIKRAIKVYYGETSIEYQYMNSYLNPNKYFSSYAKLLDMADEELEEIGELCDPCNLEKETLELFGEDLEMLLKSM